MKKSFLSFLLGVAVIASTSVFVSCQDYQDEFKDLQDQINEEHPALDKEVANLKATLAALQEQHDKDVQTLKDADKALEDLLSDEMVKANAYAVAQAEKALADAQAYADAAAAAAASQALKDAQAYADKVAAAEAQKEAQAALLAANEQAQALYKDAIDQLNKAIETINAQAAAEKSERQAADAALEAGYKAGDAALEAAFKDADAAIWVAVNKAQADLEEANKAIAAAQATADKALDLAQSNQKAIAAEVERATKAEADLKAGIEANKSAIEQEATERAAAVKSIWEAIEKANADIAANTAEIQRVNDELNKKIDAAVDRIKTLENKVATLQEEMKAAQAELSAQDARIISLEAWVGAWEPQIKDLQTRMSDAETKIANLQEQINQEIADRIAADNTLQGNIDAEKADREQADADLQAQVTANLNKIEAEILRAQTREGELAADILTNKNDIAALTLRVAANEVEIAKLWEALGAEETARKEADEAETKARKAADQSEETAREAADQKEASLRAQADAKEAADRMADDVKEAGERKAQDAILKSLIESEASARQSADAAETSARIAADAALKAELLIEIGKEAAARQAQDAILQSNITAEEAARIAADGELQDSIDAVAADLKALDAKVEGYYTEICDRLTADEKKIAGALENPFEVISEVDFQAAYGPVYSYEYYPAFSVEVAGEKFEEDNRIIADTYEQEPGKVYVLLAPQGNNFAGHQIYVKDEKNVDYPGYTFGTAVPAVYPEDVYFNAAWGWVTRAEEAAEEKTVTGPIWMADVTAEDPTEEELLANIPVEMPIRPRAAAEDTKAPEFGLVPRYSVIGEYTQKNADLKDVKLLVWDENFDFWMTPDTYKPTKADELDEADLDFETIGDEYDVNVDFTGADDELIYKQMVICDSAYNECDELDAAAAEYMNGLDEKFGEWVESAELEDFTVTVADEYANYTFFYTWHVVGMSGEVYEFVDEAQIVPEFDETVEATFNFEVTPESADIQITDVLTESVEGIDITTLGWSKYVPDCQNVTVEFAPVKAAPEESLVFNLKDVKDYVAPAAKETATCTKEEVDDVAGLGITYDPAKLVVDEPYEYTVTVKYGDEVISVSTINIIMRRPEGHDIELEKITSTWNSDKTRTIVWARGFDEQDPYSDAWYLLKGSFTNIMDYVAPVDPCGCTLVFTDNTDYSGAAELTIVELPDTANSFNVVVPAEAVQANAKLQTLTYDQVFDGNGWFYDLAYGTNVFGLESLYGGENEFQIAYASPIYYDGAKYDWEAKDYDPDGKCVLVNNEGKVDANGLAVFYIEFPKMEYSISEANFKGSNDPSSSIVDPIKYFGEQAPDYATWEANRDAVYVTETEDELLYQDARIQKIEITMGDAADIKDLYPSYYVWNDPTNEYLFAQLPTIGKDGITFRTYDEYPSLTSTPAFYYNFTVTDIWGCKKNYPFIITINPNIPVQPEK